MTKAEKVFTYCKYRKSRQTFNLDPPPPSLGVERYALYLLQYSGFPLLMEVNLEIKKGDRQNDKFISTYGGFHFRRLPFKRLVPLFILKLSG